MIEKYTIESKNGYYSLTGDQRNEEGLIFNYDYKTGWIADSFEILDFLDWLSENKETDDKYYDELFGSDRRVLKQMFRKVQKRGFIGSEWIF